MSDKRHGYGRHGRTITVERNDTPAASFYMAAAPWVEKAACLSSDPHLFFENLFEIVGLGKMGRRRNLEKVQGICAACPVRTECGEEAMLQEADATEDHRFGFRAYMTPDQRVSIARRGGLKGRDPMDVVNGWDGKRKVPPVPPEGDKWSRHHTTLARKVVKWVVDNIEIGERLPTQTELCATLTCTAVPLRRVMDALVQDGTLDYQGVASKQGRNATNTVYVRRGQPRAISSWLPIHLRTGDEGNPCAD